MIRDDIAIGPMTEEFILWRCLHFGPLSPESIDDLPADSEVSFERYRERNLRLLRKLTRTYGACGILARDGDDVIGSLRFFPKAVLEVAGTDGFCLQQSPPAGPEDNLADVDFPALEQIEDKTIVVNCMMSGPSLVDEKPYLRRGIGSRMVRALIQWAREWGWERIEADAFEDLPIVYGITGGAGIGFWEKLGFNVVERHTHPYLLEPSEFRDTLDRQAAELGIDPERARDKIVMRLDLKQS